MSAIGSSVRGVVESAGPTAFSAVAGITQPDVYVYLLLACAMWPT